MTFQELQQKIGSQTESDWHQALGGGWIHKSAKVDNEANITENAIVWGLVYGDAQVSGNAWVFGNAWVKSPLFIIGSRFNLTNCKSGHIQIGCECHAFDWWKENGMELAKRENFTPEEIIEYTAYIDLFCKIGN